jgi:hypothetical protein
MENEWWWKARYTGISGGLARKRLAVLPRFIADERGESPEHRRCHGKCSTRRKSLNVYLDKRDRPV